MEMFWGFVIVMAFAGAGLAGWYMVGRAHERALIEKNLRQAVHR